MFFLGFLCGMVAMFAIIVLLTLRALGNFTGARDRHKKR